MTRLENALRLAGLGFYLFPVRSQDKKPAVTNWQKQRTRDPLVIESWHKENPELNFGIYAGEFGEARQHLFFVDIDNKNGKTGSENLRRWMFDQGVSLPDTFEQETPNGGYHLAFTTPHAVRQGVGKIVEGVDIRAEHGLVVAAGSSLPTGEYTANYHEVASAPEWLLRELGRTTEEKDRPGQPSKEEEQAIDQKRAAARGLEILRQAGTAYEGERNPTGYKLAAQLKEAGCTKATILDLMQFEWDCVPPLPEAELRTFVCSAYSGSKEPFGASAPEKVFTPKAAAADGEGEDEGLFEDDSEGIVAVFQKINAEHAVVLDSKGQFSIMRECKDVDGHDGFKFLNLSAAENMLANMYRVKRNTKSLAKQWLEWSGRRQYTGGIILDPTRLDRDIEIHGQTYFNTWRGFRVIPATGVEGQELSKHPAVAPLLGHIFDNVCWCDRTLFSWYVSYLAHLFQKPGEKPETSVAMKGGKGVGKTIIAEILHVLLGGHFFLTAERRYLESNFNSHLEGNLCLVLDEAYWGGSKAIESMIKNLITGLWHVIERKGHEPYKVRNYTRVFMIGNEDWLTPSSVDERRFAVFYVGGRRRQNREYFGAIINALEAQYEGGNGYSYLLAYLLGYQIDADINVIPNTIGLRLQKEESLDAVNRWWMESLYEGEVLGSEWNKSLWGQQLSAVAIVELVRRYVKASGRPKSYVPPPSALGRTLSLIWPEVKRVHAANKELETADGKKAPARIRNYVLPELDAARAHWMKYMSSLESTWEEYEKARITAEDINA